MALIDSILRVLTDESWHSIKNVLEYSWYSEKTRRLMFGEILKGNLCTPMKRKKAVDIPNKFCASTFLILFL